MEKNQKALEPARTGPTTQTPARQRGNGAGNGQLARAPEQGLARPIDISRLSTPELVARIAHDAQDLLRAEVGLAKSELRTTIEGVTAAAKRMVIAAVLLTGAYLTLIAAAVAGLAQLLETWAAALVVGGALLVLGGIVALLGARAAPGAPMERTRKSLKQDLRLAREPGNVD